MVRAEIIESLMFLVLKMKLIRVISNIDRYRYNGKYNNLSLIVK